MQSSYSDFRVGRKFEGKTSGTIWTLDELDHIKDTILATSDKLLRGHFSVSNFDSYFTWVPDLPIGFTPNVYAPKCECGSDALAWMSGHHDTRCPKYKKAEELNE